MNQMIEVRIVQQGFGWNAADVQASAAECNLFLNADGLKCELDSF